MRIRVLLSVLALATGVIAAHHPRQLTLADISICSNCGAAINVDGSTARSEQNLTVSVPGSFGAIQP